MKKVYSFILIAAIALAGFTACQDLDDISNRLYNLEQTVADLSKKAQNSVTVTSVSQTTDGYSIAFSDGTTANLKNGVNGKDGDSFLKSINESDDTITIVLSDGSAFVFAKYTESSIAFMNGEAELSGVKMAAGTSADVTLALKGIEDYIITAPQGWSVSDEDGILTISAPQTVGSKGVVKVLGVSGDHSRIASLNVEAISAQRVLTFEDADGSSYWSSLVDNAQYGGALLYGDYTGSTTYSWADEGNTFLANSFVTPYWNGGHAISNYCTTDCDGYSYDRQLAVYNASGHNGSKNFAVHNGASASFGFSDGVERVIESLYVCNTAYSANSQLGGDAFAAGLGSDGYFNVIATGYDKEGSETGTAKFALGQGANVVKDWTKWDLSALGKVATVKFSFDGSDVGEWGLNTPQYFAYDDVTVLVDDVQYVAK